MNSRKNVPAGFKLQKKMQVCLWIDNYHDLTRDFIYTLKEGVIPRCACGWLCVVLLCLKVEVGCGIKGDYGAGTKRTSLSSGGGFRQHTLCVFNEVGCICSPLPGWLCRVLGDGLLCISVLTGSLSRSFCPSSAQSHPPPLTSDGLFLRTAASH